MNCKMLDLHPTSEQASMTYWSKHLLRKSETQNSHSMLEQAKIIWLIRTFLLRNQRHWTHMLCWNMQRLFDWSEHSFWEIRGTGLTCYVGTCKDYLTDQNIPFEKSEALDSHAMLEHAKIIWLIRTFLLRNQRHWTHNLCWNMQRLFDWSEHSFWEIRDTGLTAYVGTCKDYLTDQNIPFEKSEALDSHAMLRHADWSEHFFWKIRGTGLTCYVGTCKDYLIDQNIPFEKSEPLDSQSMLEHVRLFDWSEHSFLEIKGTGLTVYVGTCKDYFTD